MSGEQREKLSAQDAARVARLARLNIDEETLGRFAEQFNEILSYMDKLGELDTSGVEPLYSPSEHATVLREDKAVNRPRREEILANAPEDDGRFFIVPKIVQS